VRNWIALSLLRKTTLSKMQEDLELHTSYGGVRHEVSRIKLARMMSHMHCI
jgi:hypothetical protein